MAYNTSNSNELISRTYPQMAAATFANYMLYIMSDAFDDLTNMKINKLLYFAQGHYLSKYKKPLFQDAFEAWEHGPVIPSVYAKYKKYGDEPIKEYDIADIPEMPKEIDDILFGIARKYGTLTASALRNKTHVVGSPWYQVYNGQRHTIIPTQMIQDYFSESTTTLEPIEKHFKDSDFVGYRDSEGYLVLPKE